jgi:FkbM family methyltransferase
MTTNNLLNRLRGIGSSATLRRLGPLHRGLKSIFNSAVGLVSEGATIELGNKRPVVVPWDLVGASRWSDYEPVTAELFARLVEEQPAMTAVDIGCSIGIFSLLALSVSREARVYSMDADLMALAMARAMGRSTGADRHRFIWGFCGNAEMSRSNPLRADLEGGARRTEEIMKQANLRPSIGANRYTCIDHQMRQDIPCWDVDSLFGPLAEAGRPLLLKVDIEGAEKLMVEGAARLLGRPNVQFLVGVHPGRLPGFGTTRERLWESFSAKGNTIELVEKDTEEHWWVQPTS